MCSGRVDLAFVLRAFSKGMDGVFIGGCHLGECHYVTEGNVHALNMVLLCRKLMKHIGLDPGRLRIEWISAGEGIRFAEIMNDFAGQLEEMGPLGKSEGLDEKTLKLRLEAATNLVPYIRLVERERLRVRFDTEEEARAFFDSDEMSRLFHELIAEKFTLSQIMLLMRERPRPAGEIAGVLGLSPSEVARHLHDSARQGLLRFDADRNCYAPA
jgi:F420-non-reducing hydrogenase iron-sulfur subunit